MSLDIPTLFVSARKNVSLAEIRLAGVEGVPNPFDIKALCGQTVLTAWLAKGNI
jgi:hypothetical protein